MAKGMVCPACRTYVSCPSCEGFICPGCGGELPNYGAAPACPMPRYDALDNDNDTEEFEEVWDD